jgi:Alkylmercury lyase
MSTTIDQLLADRARAGFPTPARRRQGLPAPLRDLHRRILGHFATTGQPPPPTTLTAWAAELGVGLADALGRLVQTDLVEADPTGRLAGAYPFVSTSRGHEVRLPGGPIVQAYCAVDALGIPAMLDQDATITSHDPLTGVPVTVQVQGGRAHWEPAGAVVGYCADAGEAGQAACCRCPLINFHASTATAQAWQDRHRQRLTVLSMPQALELGAVVFGDLLRPGPDDPHGDPAGH